MIEPGSAVGFFLAFVAGAWALAAAAAAIVALVRPRLRRLGPAAEKRFAALVVCGPVVIGVAVSAFIAAYSAVPAWFGGVDHCDAHGHHLHLCLAHGGAWASEPWAVVAGAAIAALFVARAARLILAIVEGRRRLAMIAATSRPEPFDGGTLHIVPSQRAFCFAAGLWRPRVFVASSFWQRLDAEQRAAVVAHERAHIVRRDLWQALGLSLCELVAAPLLARRARRDWDRATERLCDRVAAEQAGGPAPVAEALLAWARGARSPVGLAFSPTADAFEERVVAVLAEQPVGTRSATWIAWGALGLFAVVCVKLALRADSVHHALETVFGLL